MAQSGHTEGCPPMSAFGGKADINKGTALCPLLTQSGQGAGIRLSGFMECRWDHSALILAARTTFAHFSVSSAISLPKSAGEPGSPVAPKSASRDLIFGSSSAALISLLSLSMIPAGV